mgnify:CR=1 FL=1
MKRRELLKMMAMSASSVGMPLLAKPLFAQSSQYTGPLFLTLQVSGAWDVSSFCDPKTNISGAPEINRWSQTAGIQQAGNIPYAPFGNNNALFEKYHRDMLIINGVDTQTNAHSVGILHNWSGRNAVGYPSLPALFSATYAPNLPLSYINFGGYANSAGLVRYSRLNGIDNLGELLIPNVADIDKSKSYRNVSDMEKISALQQQRLDRLSNNETLLPRQRNNAAAYAAALNNGADLETFANTLLGVDSFQEEVEVGGTGSSDLLTQIQLSVLAFSAGVACSGDLYVKGFDTHNDHDQDHEPRLAHLADAIDYLWTYAEERGVADRLTLMIASDFARTPYYNSTDGKDHWPIGSVICMKKEASWGNRVVGSTDSAQAALALNPSTLVQDNNGVIIQPGHIHKALRTELGLDGAGLAFPFELTDDLDIFNPAL